MAVDTDACLICGFNDYVEECHIIPKSEGGRGKGIMFLCPNHHKQYDIGRLPTQEIGRLPIEAQNYYRKKFNLNTKVSQVQYKTTPKAEVSSTSYKVVLDELKAATDRLKESVGKWQERREQEEKMRAYIKWFLRQCGFGRWLDV